MIINQEECIGCGKCVPYCPMKAISIKDRKAIIEYDECVECGVCLTCASCPKDAIIREELQWPRIVRAELSNPRKVYTGKFTSGYTGRGTEEMKTNDVTGRFPPGYFGLGIEMGRPGIGTRLRNVEKVAMLVAEFVSEFEPANPITQLMSDPQTGKFKEEVLNEKVLSAIIEFSAPLEQLPRALDRIKELEKGLDTVFCVSLISIYDKNGTTPVEKIAEEHGFLVSNRGKVNVGLGRRPDGSQYLI